ncbi:MAG: acyl-CoA/acyl-ACP dehydrogenase [Deltaproteobacteria bacterium]|nr:acyl-CoA/acyl-ACP dehydrogenase [Deltaproteobacteria bacterium]
MDFHLSEEQKMLKESARDFLQMECPKTFVREMEKDPKGYTPELWRKMANLGWMGIVFPEEYGGIGGDFLDLLVLLEEMGRACLPGPFFSTVVLGGLSILEAGTESQKKEFLTKIASGDLILTLAHIESATRQFDPYLIDVRALAEQNGYLIDGIKIFVPDAHVAKFMICVARTKGEMDSKEGITLFLIDARSPGIKWELLKTVARDKQCEVLFQKVRVPQENILGGLDRGGSVLEKLLQKAAIAKCGEMIGGAQFVLDMCVSYAKEREQFGKLIGTFQAVQHHCANMLINIEGGRYISYKAAWMLSNGIPCKRQVALAKAWVSDAYKRVVGLGHQIMAGTGYMEEHDMPLYSRRAKAAEIAFGDANYYKKIVAKEIGL